MSHLCFFPVTVLSISSDGRRRVEEIIVEFQGNYDWVSRQFENILAQNK